MALTDLFWGIGEVFEKLLSIYDENLSFTFIFNTAIVLGGFVGLFCWLRLQLNFNKKAKNDPNQLK